MLPLKATNKIVPHEEGINKIATETISIIGTFAEREFFILISLYKSPKERKVILGTSDYEERKLNFLKKIQYKKNKKKLYLMKSQLYSKFTLRTCLCGTEHLIKTPLRTMLGVFEATRGTIIVSASSVIAIIASLTPVPVYEAFGHSMDTFSDLCCHRNDPIDNLCYPEILFDECWNTESSCDSLIKDKKL